MKKETKENIKSNVATGASSAVGAGIGVVAGSVIATDVNAAETSGMPIHTEEEEEVVVVSSAPERQTTQQSVASSASGLEGEPEVEVVSYETVMNDDGSVMDVAVVSVDGQQAVVADVDMQRGLVLVSGKGAKDRLVPLQYFHIGYVFCPNVVCCYAVTSVKHIHSLYIEFIDGLSVIVNTSITIYFDTWHFPEYISNAIVSQILKV